MLHIPTGSNDNQAQASPVFWLRNGKLFLCDPVVQRKLNRTMYLTAASKKIIHIGRIILFSRVIRLEIWGKNLGEKFGGKKEKKQVLM